MTADEIITAWDRADAHFENKKMRRCKYCGAEFEAVNTQYGGTFTFCSKKCNEDWNRDNRYYNRRLDNQRYKLLGVEIIHDPTPPDQYGNEIAFPPGRQFALIEFQQMKTMRIWAEGTVVRHITSGKIETIIYTKKKKAYYGRKGSTACSSSTPRPD